MRGKSHINLEVKQGVPLKVVSDVEEDVPCGQPEKRASVAEKEKSDAAQDWMSDISTVAPDTPRSVASCAAWDRPGAGWDLEDEIIDMEKELVELAVEKARTERRIQVLSESGEGKEPPEKGVATDATLEDAAKNGFCFGARSAMGCRFTRWLKSQPQETKDKYEAAAKSRPRLQKFKRDWAQGLWDEYSCKKSFVEETVELTNGASGKTNPTGQPNLKTQTDIIWFFKYTLSC